MQNKRSIFFDLDGVLVDACDWHFEALNKALKKNDEQEISLVNHHAKFDGLPTKTKLQMLDVSKEKFTKIIAEKNKFFDEIMESKCVFDNSKNELLSYLRNKNCKIACVSNSIRSTIENILKKLDIIRYFDLILSNEDVKINKPDPYPYNLAIELLKAESSINIAIEDSAKGIESASKSKINVVWKVKNATEVNLINYKSTFGE
jgi:beta-phosphoglucomutase